MVLAVKLGKLIRSFSLLRRKFGLVGLAQGTQAFKTEHIKMTCSSLFSLCVVLSNWGVVVNYLLSEYFVG